MLVSAVELQGPAQCLDFSTDGKFLAIGYENGLFELFSCDPNENFHLDGLRLFNFYKKSPIECVLFAPSNRYLVVSCEKNIVVFNPSSEDFDQEGQMRGNQNSIISL